MKQALGLQRRLRPRRGHPRLAHPSLRAGGLIGPVLFDSRDVPAVAKSCGPKGGGSLRSLLFKRLRMLDGPLLAALTSVVNRIVSEAALPTSELSIVCSCTPKPSGGERAISLLGSVARIVFRPLKPSLVDWSAARRKR